MTGNKIVREQCWLNEILKGCDWTTDGLDANEDQLLEESEPTEDDLHAVLSGANRCQFIHQIC